MAADRADLERQAARIDRRLQRGQPADRALDALSRALAASAERTSARAAALPEPVYPEALPVTSRRAALLEAVRRHQVVVVCGATGSGKTTQLPKIALEAGCGRRGWIGHTQPRRLAARTVARRIAEEFGEPLGQAVGYKVRFDEQLSPAGYIKLMTDGVLLAEIHRDPLLSAYDGLIVDEAHERSLNIDFLLGYLTRLLPRRPDLKLIITSATIDPERFAAHFGGAPILQVSGRTYPVTVRYRPPEEGGEVDLPAAVVAAVHELDREAPGDVLVFLPGERDIREVALALRREALRHTEVLPLYARLAARAQNQVFQPHRGRRIVLATNVAETSLTVPGIRYVIDSGLARISRYSRRSRITRLPIEPISRASADQRAGRCGRTAPGICIRLYSEADSLARPEFTTPEIARTNLAAVILQLKALGETQPERFPFIDPPPLRDLRDGITQLQALGALDGAEALTPLGRDLARLPLDPAIGRMVLAGAEHGCLHEVLIIAAALSIQDPRERPAEQAQAADAAHARFAVPESDFLGYLKLWAWCRSQRGSRREFEQACERNFLSRTRLREWQEVHRELLSLAHELRLRVNHSPADPASVHRALLTGLLWQIGARHPEQGYTGVRGVRFELHPGSVLARRPPKWVMSAELVETRRLFARINAPVEPDWIEQAGAALLKRRIFEPHWEKRAGRIVSYEQTSLYGLILTARRRVHYGALEPEHARELFIRAALVAGDYDSPGAFQRHNRTLLEALREEEAKLRRPDLVDEQALFDFYDARIPPQVCTARAFERWREDAERAQPALLRLTREALLGEHALVATERFPPELIVGELRLPLRYHFAPGEPDDGVTVALPLAQLNQVPAEAFDWLVPGLLEARIEALLRGLPKALRRNFVPVPNFARALVEAIGWQPQADFYAIITRELQRMTGVLVPAQAWSPAQVPAHLRLRIEVCDAAGQQVAAGRALPALRERLAGRAQSAFAARVEVAPDATWQQRTVERFDVEALPVGVQLANQGRPLTAYPAFAAGPGEGQVQLALFDTPDRAEAALRGGLAVLVQKAMPDKLRFLRRELQQRQAMCLHYAPLGSCSSLLADIEQAAIEAAFLQEPLPRRRQAFEARLTTGRPRLLVEAGALADLAQAALAEYHALRGLWSRLSAPALAGAVADTQRQIGRLLAPGFVSRTPPAWRGRLPVYVQAARLRLEQIGGRVARDAQWQEEVRQWEQRCEAGRAEPGGELRWLIEEYRVSLFAQRLGTREKISAQRLGQALAQESM